MMAVENARLSRLIENFLTFSRLERNRHQFVFAPSTRRPSSQPRSGPCAIGCRLTAI